MMRALIEGERIAQIVAPGEEFPVAAPLVWVDVPDNATTQDRWIDGVVVPADPEPEPPTASRLPRLVIADRLTDDEVALVAGLQSGTPEQQRWWLRWVSASEIDVTDPANVAAFEAVFGAERAAELLAMEDDETV